MRAAMTGVLVALLLGGVAGAGTGAAPPLRVERTVRMTLHPTPPPASRGPQTNVEDVVFLGPEEGLLAASARGAWYDGSGTGSIQRTLDGGTFWAPVWSKARSSVTWIGFADRSHGFAAGVAYPSGYPRNTSPLPFLLRSADGGRSWETIRPRLPSAAAARAWPWLDFVFPSERVGVAVTDPDYYSDLRGAALRTTDGGRHWQLLRLPGAFVTGVDFVGPRLGYATGWSPGRCSGEVFRTIDAGKSWRPVTGTCRPYQLSAVSFLDARTGFVAGGRAYFAEQRPFQAVLATSDGGRTWTTRFDGQVEAHPGLPIVRLRFTDPLHGWAATGGCKMGQNAPCGGAVLVTDDGGRSWRDTGFSAGEVEAGGRTRAWIVPPCDGGSCGVVWRTRDAGRSWQPLARPEGVSLGSVEAAGSWLLLSGSAGTFRSLDRGATWRPFAPPRPPGTPRWANELARPGLLVVWDREALQISHDGGRSWRKTTVPDPKGVDISSLAFADPQHGLVAELGSVCNKGGIVLPSRLFATDDGGGAWRALPTQEFEVWHLALGRSLAVAEVATGCRSLELALSRDGGQTWRLLALPTLADCSPSIVEPETVWVLCMDLPRDYLLVSRDAGETWTRFTTRDLGLRSLAVTGTGDAWLVGQGREPAATLWHSGDGGRTWDERWPRLPIR